LSDFMQSEDALLDAFAVFCDEQKYYEAYALALDNYETVELFSTMLADESEPGDMIGLFLLFCKEQDRERAIKYAVILIDLYKRNELLEKIVELSYHFTCNFVEPLANTSSQLIMKEGISAAVSLLDTITDTVPTKEIIVFICANMHCFPALSKDKEFSMPLIGKLTSHYKSEHRARLYVISCFLPSIKRGLEALEGRYASFSNINGIDAEELAKYAQEVRQYHDLIFVDGYPVLDGNNPFEINPKRTKELEYLDMIREHEALKVEILSLDEHSTVFPPALEERHTKLLEYFLEYNIADSNVEIMRVSHLISCFAMCRYVDMEYALEGISALASKLLDFEVDDFTYTGTIYHLQTSLLELSEVYELVGDDSARYKSYLKYMELGNAYFKRTCFEDGLGYFIESVESEYFLYHSIVSKATKVALDNDFSLNPLYFEMSKRKNLIYLGEMWLRQGSNAVEISKLLEREFSFDELQQSIGNTRALVDFFYMRINNEDSEGGGVFDRNFIHDIKNFACFAFVVHSVEDVQFYVVDEGVYLAESISSEEDSADYFWNITEHIFQNINADSLIVCADGDINQLNIAALPFRDGYVIDHYPVRNIGSVMDIVYPRKPEHIKSALMFNAPYYNETEDYEQNDKWEYLAGSEIEQEIVAEILADKFGVAVECLHGLTATKSELLDRVKNTDGILHISTHGNAVDGEVSIITAGANIPGVDAMISDREMRGGYLESIPLAVFALCFGAKQLASLQDSLSGFIKAALLSGVNSIIAPIKPIYDISTVFLLCEFYKYYLTEQREGGASSVEQALQIAIQRTRGVSWAGLRQEYGIELEIKDEYPFSDPKHWAAWVCYSREEIRQ